MKINPFGLRNCFRCESEYTDAAGIPHVLCWACRRDLCPADPFDRLFKFMASVAAVPPLLTLPEPGR